MGFWAGIKRALNSTLGTSSFKPLDEQIANLKTLYASDDLYLTIEGSGATVSDNGSSNTVDCSKTIAMLQSGSLKVGCELNGSTNRGARWRIYKNKELIQSFHHANAGTLLYVSNVIYVDRGDVLSFEFEAVNSSNTSNASNREFSDIQIFGNVVDNVVQIKGV